jgi:hypothetical protein
MRPDDTQSHSSAMVCPNHRCRRRIPDNRRPLFRSSLRLTWTLDASTSTVTHPHWYVPTLDVVGRLLTSADQSSGQLCGSPGPWMQAKGSQAPSLLHNGMPKSLMSLEGCQRLPIGLQSTLWCTGTLDTSGEFTYTVTVPRWYVPIIDVFGGFLTTFGSAGNFIG